MALMAGLEAIRLLTGCLCRDHRKENRMKLKEIEGVNKMKSNWFWFFACLLGALINLPFVLSLGNIFNAFSMAVCLMVAGYFFHAAMTAGE
jgi:hypothetical protein